jgi:hypothetical protein
MAAGLRRGEGWQKHQTANASSNMTFHVGCLSANKAAARIPTSRNQIP